MTGTPGATPDFRNLSDADLAAMQAAEGDRIAVRRGTAWRSTFPGFFQPARLTAPLRLTDIGRPTLLCWGVRAALAPSDAADANATMPVYLLETPAGFAEGVLSRNRRSDLRRCRRLLTFRALHDTSLLDRQGHRVFMSAVRRLGYWRPMSEKAYRDRVARRMRHGHRLVVAGLLDGELAGYLDAYAAEGVLFPEEIFIATDALRTGIGTGLYVEVLARATAESGIREVCNGLHTPEDPDLCRFKESLGFHMVHLPARTRIPAPIRAWIRASRPATYYRLTGQVADGAGRAHAGQEAGP